MLVHGAIIPPRAVLDAVDAVVRSVPEPSVELEATPSARGLLGRLGRHRAESAEPPPAAPPMLQHVPVERMVLPITGFGNLTTNDAYRVVDAIKTAAKGWRSPTVRFAGGTALDFPGDWSVWAKLDGADSLPAIARGVTEAVEGLGFFVDRRQFRSMLSVATVTEATTGPYLQAVVDALESFRSDDWIAEISLTKETFVGGRPELTEFVRIPLTG